MKKSTKITTAIVISLGLITAGGAYAAKKHNGDHELRAELAVTFIAKKLDLDSTQEQALTVLKDQMLVAKTAMHNQMDTTQDDVRMLVEADSFDQGKALEMITTKTATIDTVAPELVVALGNFLDSLDAEQKDEILEFMNSRNGKGKRSHWRH